MVTKPDTSNDSNDLHPKNINFIFVTLRVTKLVKVNLVNKIHPKTINAVVTTSLELNFEKSIFDSLSHSANI